MSETIKDFYGRTLGRIDYEGGRYVAKDFYGRVLGSYDPRDNWTRDFHGRMLYQGNALAALIVNN